MSPETTRIEALTGSETIVRTKPIPYLALKISKYISQGNDVSRHPADYLESSPEDQVRRYGGWETNRRTDRQPVVAPDWATALEPNWQGSGYSPVDVVSQITNLGRVILDEVGKDIGSANLYSVLDTVKGVEFIPEAALLAEQMFVAALEESRHMTVEWREERESFRQQTAEAVAKIPPQRLLYINRNNGNQVMTLPSAPVHGEKLSGAYFSSLPDKDLFAWNALRELGVLGHPSIRRMLPAVNAQLFHNPEFNENPYLAQDPRYLEVIYNRANGKGTPLRLSTPDSDWGW